MAFRQTALTILAAHPTGGQTGSGGKVEQSPCMNHMAAYKIIPDASGTFLLVVCYWIMSCIRSVFPHCI